MKRSSITVVLVLLVCAVVLGFYRGWFSLSSHGSDTGSKQVNVNLTVDGDKMREDAETVKKKATELTGGAADRANAIGDTATDNK